MLYQEFQGEKEDCNQGPLFQVPAKLFWEKSHINITRRNYITVSPYLQLLGTRAQHHSLAGKTWLEWKREILPIVHFSRMSNFQDGRRRCLSVSSSPSSILQGLHGWKCREAISTWSTNSSWGSLRYVWGFFWGIALHNRMLFCWKESIK